MFKSLLIFCFPKNRMLLGLLMYTVVVQSLGRQMKVDCKRSCLVPDPRHPGLQNENLFQNKTKPNKGKPLNVMLFFLWLSLFPCILFQRTQVSNNPWHSVEVFFDLISFFSLAAMFLFITGFYS